MCYAFHAVACVSLTLMLYALHAYLFSSCAYCTWFCCLHDHVAHLAHMPRLHYIGMHTLPLELSMIEVEFIVCLCAFHSTLKLHTLVLWAITHWNARFVVRESSTMLLWAINMIRSVVGANIAWNALPCHVLPSAAVKIGSAGCFGRPAIYTVDRPSIVGRWLYKWSMTIWTWPVVFCLSRWCSTVSIECSLGLVQFSEEQSRENRGKLVHGVGFPSKPEHALHWTLFPRLFTAFLD